MPLTILTDLLTLADRLQQCCARPPEHIPRNLHAAVTDRSTDITMALLAAITRRLEPAEAQPPSLSLRITQRLRVSHTSFQSIAHAVGHDSDACSDAPQRYGTGAPLRAVNAR